MAHITEYQRIEKDEHLAVDTAVSLFFQNDQDANYLQLSGTGSLSNDKSKMRAR